MSDMPLRELRYILGRLVNGISMRQIGYQPSFIQQSSPRISGWFGANV